MGKKPERAVRPLAWALLLTGDTARAREYYSRLVSSQPTYADCLNAGYAAMLDNDMPEAIRLFLCRPTVSTAILPDGSTVSAPRFPLSTPLASTHCFRHSWSTHSSTVIRNFGRHCRIKINFLR